MGRLPLGVAAFLLPLLAACSAPLPDPESAGARLYQSRCSGCHALYAPGSLTAAMWKVQVDRMQGEVLRRSGGPLTDEERAVMLSYLEAHATDAAARAAAGSPAAP